MTEEQQQEEYAVKHFGFAAPDFVAFAEESANECVSKYLMEFEKAYTSKTGNDISKRMEDFQKDCSPYINEFVSRVSTIAHEHFTIPHNVLLPQDEVQSVQYTDEEQTQLDSEIEQLEQQLKNEYYLESRLQKELSKASQLDESKIIANEDDIDKMAAFVQDNTILETEDTLQMIYDRMEQVYGRQIVDTDGKT